MNKTQNNRLSEGKTAGLVTGKSQHSAFDFFEKIETNFLEKYLLYLVKDDQGQKFLKVNDVIDNHNMTNMYTVSNNFKMSNFMDSFSKQLSQIDNKDRPPQIPIGNKIPKKNQSFIKVYENQAAIAREEIKVNELLFIYSKFKLTHQKMRDLGKDIQKKLLREKEILKKCSEFKTLLQQQQKYLENNQPVPQELQNQIEKQQNKNKINIVVFYTGDVNFRYGNDPFFSEGIYTQGNCTFEIRVNIFYVSKVILFQYFCQSNNLNIEQIDDKTITLFELRRMSLKRRSKAIQNARKQEEQNLKNKSALIRSQSKNSQENIQKQNQQLQSQTSFENNNNISLNNSAIQKKNLGGSGIKNIMQRAVNYQSKNRSFSYSFDKRKEQIQNLAQVSIIVGLSLSAPFIIKKCFKQMFQQK